MISIQKPVKPVKRKTPDGPPSTPKVKKDPETSGYDTLHFDKFNGPAKQFTWEEVKEIREHSYRAGLPDQTDPKAIEIMNQLCVAHWDAPMKAFLKASHKKVKDTLMQQLQEVFSQYHQTGLYWELVRIVGGYLQRLHDDHFEQAKEMFNIEHAKPFTMDTGALENATKKQLEHLKTRRHQVRAGCYLDLQGKFAADDPRRDAEIKKLGEAELGPDLFAQEVKMMAIARGYYGIASSRFVDGLCQSLHTKLFSKCRDGLLEAIEQELRIFDSNAMERCLELMAEDPERQRRRQHLMKEKQKVTKAQEWLSSAKRDETGDEAGDHGYVQPVVTLAPHEWA
ncbi:Dynamin family [Aspergillus sp. HF37]|nr:Dynamin family [Aspergillus sp. HF37]